MSKDTTIIERDTKMYFQNILNRLNKEEQKQLIVLQREINNHQKDIDYINNIIIDFNELTKD